MNEQNLKPFKPGQSGNPKGRPKGTINRVPEYLNIILGKRKAKKYYAITEEEIKAWDMAIMTMSLDELKIMAKLNTTPVYARNMALAILNDMKNGKTTCMDKLKERYCGKVSQKVELTGANGTNLIPAQCLSKDEAAELMQKLNSDY